mmetsp:Transcript_21577/g.65495  ORF Transcript_21577/g.65495 Transcript_21577/m.65495 type:complete len:112 (+) Transcript_21577:440-775(+)
MVFHSRVLMLGISSPKSLRQSGQLDLLAVALSKQGRQNVWPHAVVDGSKSRSRQTVHRNSSSNAWSALELVSSSASPGSVALSGARATYAVELTGQAARLVSATLLRMPGC